MPRFMISVILGAALWCGSAAGSAGPSATVRTDPAALVISSRVIDSSRYSIITSGDGSPGIGAPGEPALPGKVLRFAIPAGFTVTGVVATARGTGTIDLMHPPLPAQPPVPLDGSPRPPFAGPARSIYEGTDPFPEQLAGVSRTGMMGGQMIAEIEVRPVQYLPSGHRLLLHAEIDVSLTLARDGDAPSPAGHGLRRAAHFEASATGTVVNPQDLAPVGSHQDGVPPDSDAVDYLLITGGPLLPAFARLADWRGRTGLRTRVLTVEAIAGTYPGGDIPARIRRCIQDYRAHHGTSFVVLGGGTATVPVRYVPWTLWPDYIPDLRIPTDLYYSDVCDTSSIRDPYQYRFDANNNGSYGELGLHGDAIDFSPDVLLGRIPVDELASAQAYVDKVLAYEQSPPQGFGSSVLLMADQPFAPLVELVHQIVLAPYAPSIDPHELYTPVSGTGWSGDEPLTAASAKQQLSAGCNLAFHIDHGGTYSLGTGVGSGGGWLYRGDVAALGNVGRASIIATPSCGPNAFDHASFANTLIGDPDGGAVAFVGNSRVGFDDQAHQCRQFFTALFRDRARHLGAAFQMLQYYSPFDYCWYGMNLMGDPAMPVWTGEPSDLEVSHNAALAGIAKRVTVTVSAGPAGDSVDVCLKKDGDFQRSARIAIPGTHGFNVVPTGPGFLHVTVTGRDCRPYRDSAWIGQDNVPPVRVAALSCLDGEHGNGDGVANPGESVLVVPMLVLDTLRPVSRLTIAAAAISEGIDVIGSRIEPATVPPPQPHADVGRKDAFAVKVWPGTRSGNARLSLAFHAVSPEGRARVWSQTVTLPILSDSLAHQSHRVTLRPEAIAAPSAQSPVYAAIATVDSIVLANLGDGTSGRAHVRLVSDSPEAVALDEGFSLRAIEPGASVTLALPLRLGLRRGTLPDPGSVHLVVTTAAGIAISRPLTMPSLPLPHGVTASAVSGGIRIAWNDSLPQRASGYWVYRTQPGRDRFIRINSTLVTGSRAFIDPDVNANGRFAYAVAGVDREGNTGPLSLGSDTVTAQSAAMPGFPVPFGIGGRGMRLWGSPAVGDIDGDGFPDIVMGSDDGLVYAFDRHGATLPGWPVSLGVQIDNSTPALADLDGDGIAEVIMGTGAWYTAAGDGLVHALKGDGTEVSGWPAPVSGDAFGSCAAADIDGDGPVEVIAATTAGLAYAWKSNGSLLTGWPVSVGDRVATSPAIGDIDGDGCPEIIVTAVCGPALAVSALTPAGQPLPGWPKAIPCDPGYALSSPVLTDIDGDQAMEVIQAAGPEAPDGYVKVHCLNDDGTEPEGWPVYVAPNTSITASPAIADLDGDGSPDAVICTGSGIVHAVSSAGTSRPLWQSETGSNGRTNPVIADVDADGGPDVLLTTESGYLYALSGRTGSVIDGFPLWIESSWSAPAVTDLDGNGRLDLVATGWGSHRIFAWQTQSSVSAVSAWSSYRGDNARTGCYRRRTGKTAAAVPGESTIARPVASALGQNFPNPVSDRTAIHFQTGNGGRVSLSIYNIAGQHVATLADGHLPAGEHRTTWDRTDARGRRVAAGTYLYRLRSAGSDVTRKMVVVK